MSSKSNENQEKIKLVNVVYYLINAKLEKILQ